MKQTSILYQDLSDVFWRVLTGTFFNLNIKAFQQSTKFNVRKTNVVKYGTLFALFMKVRTYVKSLRIRSVKLSPPEERNSRLRISICFNPYCTTSITSWPVLHSTERTQQFTFSSHSETLNIMATIPRVSSTASELNDFQETKEGEKIYNVSVIIHNSIHAISYDLCS